MTVHVLHAGEGWQYLTRSVATQDVRRERGDSLASYYHANGTPPGVWKGSGLAALAELDGAKHAARMVAGTVTEAQMKALYGEGLHPNADPITAAVYARSSVATERGRSRAERRVAAETRLGRKFGTYSAPPVVKAADAAADAWAASHGRAPTAAEKTVAAAEAARPFFAAAHGREPATARELVSWLADKRGEQRFPVSGYDCVFTPPKSVSAVWALGGSEVRRVVEEAHHGAVDDTVGWLEANAAFTRRGARSEQQINTRGLITAQFDHWDSRAGDPNLHTHVAVSNKVMGVDGRWSALDGTALFKHGVAASQRYNAMVVGEVARRLGTGISARDMGPGKQPVLEIAGIDMRLHEAWSSRSTAIRARRDELVADYRSRHGRSPSRTTELALLQQATLETRDGKAQAQSLAEKQAAWRAQAAQVLGSASAVDTMLDRALGRDTTQGFRRFLGVDAEASRTVAALSEKRATWARPHAAGAVEARLASVRFDSATARRAAVSAVVDRVLSAESVVLAAPAAEPVPEALTRSDGSSVLDRHGEQVHTSTAVLDAEAQLLAAADEPTTAFTTRAELDASIDAGSRGLNAGQRALAEHFCLSGARLAVATGPAGAGKTTAMKAVADAWKASGRDVLALAPSAVAAENLGQEIDVDGQTLAALTYPYRGRIDGIEPGTIGRGIAAGTMLLVDEAAMASLHDLRALTEIAERTGAVVRLLGDPAQLDAVETGGTLRLLADDTNAPELSAVVRFGDDDEQSATSLLLRAGEHAATGLYTRRGWLHCADAGTLRAQIVADHLADTTNGAVSIILTDTTEDAAALNTAIQQHRRLDGAADAHDTARLADGLEAGVGDRVVTRDNDRALRVVGGTRPGSRVRNGDVWTVEAIGPDGSLTARHTQHLGAATLPAAYRERSVQLAYASTVHRAQGLTVDVGRYLANPDTANRQGLYVGLTRGRSQNHLYVIDAAPLSVDAEAMHIAGTGERPLTGPEAMRIILDHDGRQLSATAQLRAELDRADDPQAAADAYTAAQTLLRDAWADHLLDRALPAALVDEMRRDTPQYGRLRAQLGKIHDHGGRADHILAAAVNQQQPHPETDPAEYNAVLAARIRDLTPAGQAPASAGLALPPLPPRHPGADILLSDYAHAARARHAALLAALHAPGVQPATLEPAQPAPTPAVLEQQLAQTRERMLSERVRLRTDTELRSILSGRAHTAATLAAAEAGLESQARSARHRHAKLTETSRQWAAADAAAAQAQPLAEQVARLSEQLKQARRQRAALGRLARGKHDLDRAIDALAADASAAALQAQRSNEHARTLRPHHPRPTPDEIAAARADADRAAAALGEHTARAERSRQQRTAAAAELARRDALTPVEKTHEQHVRAQLRHTPDQNLKNTAQARSGGELAAARERVAHLEHQLRTLTRPHEDEGRAPAALIAAARRAHQALRHLQRQPDATEHQIAAAQTAAREAAAAAPPQSHWAVIEAAGARGSRHDPAATARITQLRRALAEAKRHAAELERAPAQPAGAAAPTAGAANERGHGRDNGPQM